MSDKPYDREQLSHDQLEALTAYAAENGRTWKDKLRTDWMYARARVWRGDNDYSAELQQVRNVFGPMWLNRFRLPPHH